MDKRKLEMGIEVIITRVRDEYRLRKWGRCKGRGKKVCQCSECGGMKLKKEGKHVVVKKDNLVELLPPSAGPAAVVNDICSTRRRLMEFLF